MVSAIARVPLCYGGLNDMNAIARVTNAGDPVTREPPTLAAGHGKVGWSMLHVTYQHVPSCQLWAQQEGPLSTVDIPTQQQI